MGLGGLDLNLLLILHALLEQRNVSRAAEQVSLSQPATSAALARLRRHFDDELLVRVGRTYELTPLAQVLCPLVASAVHHVESALEVRSAFAPGLSDRNFVVGASDYALTVMIRPLRRLLRAEAPNVSVTFASMPDDHAFDSYLLHRDLLIGPVGYGLPGRTDVVWRDHFVAILDAHNPAIVGGRLSLRALAELPHAVGVFGTQIPTPADRLLDELGVQRRVVASVDGLLALPFIVEGTDLVALIPERLARRVSTPRSGLAVAEIPNGHRAQLVEAIHCPPSRREDPALQWLRGAILRAARELDDAEDASTA